VDDAQGRVTVADRVGDHAHGKQVIDLVDSAMLAEAFLMNRIEPLDPALDFGRNPVFLQPLSNRILQIHQKRFELFSFRKRRFSEAPDRPRAPEIAEGKIFEFAANQPHSQAMAMGA